MHLDIRSATTTLKNEKKDIGTSIRPKFKNMIKQNNLEPTFERVIDFRSTLNEIVRSQHRASMDSGLNKTIELPKISLKKTIDIKVNSLRSSVDLNSTRIFTN